MQAALDAFESNMSRVRSLHALRSVFVASVTAAVDLSDILRAELVLAVSALDHFVHELTRLGMLECWSGARNSTDAFNRFQLPLSTAINLASSASAVDILDAEIRSRHGFLSFQHPDKIADAIRNFSEIRLWEEVARELGEPAVAIKTSVILIVDRRNKIAHEADMDPSYPHQRWPIDAGMVEATFERLERIARAVFKVSK
jgi:hypothetical protein